MLQIKGSHSRLGERIRTRGLVVDWYGARAVERRGRRRDATGRGERRRWRRDAEPERAEVVDVSASGARIVAREQGDLTVGTFVEIGLDGERALVRIRHLQSRGDGTAEYGTEFVKMTPAIYGVIRSYLRRER